VIARSRTGIGEGDASGYDPLADGLKVRSLSIRV
jgi:hypothetical protein